MGIKTRKAVRIQDIGRVEAPELCPLAAVLDNFSKCGLKIHYTVPVAVDLDNDYEISVIFARAASEIISLVVHPQWVKEENGTTEIGFKILPSKGTSRLAEYIKELDSEKESGVSDQITNSGCQII